MTEPRLCDEDVHLASEESSRHSTEVSVRGVKLTRARALLSEWGLYRYQWRLCRPESHSGLIMCYFFVSACDVCTCAWRVCPNGSGHDD